MTPMTISWIVFACVFAGALLGILLRRILPKHHLSEDSKDVVKLGMGLIATMAALVLALLIASAKSSHDTQSTEVTEMSADFILLDEAQDTNPVVLDVLRRQSAQMVYVGDKYQQIYEWRGAVNAMEQMATDGVTYLTMSFRFGPVIAARTRSSHLRNPSL